MAVFETLLKFSEVLDATPRGETRTLTAADFDVELLVFDELVRAWTDELPPGFELVGRETAIADGAPYISAIQVRRVD
ncbi:hypothetical protein [Chitiniphilus eburneus]|uniref:Uncharacterized protein n=1 Tax=Chitiniphilus eburneus TaxID=2571148 RepID=A0A4U0QCY9_9NEIS|nr:hypothetical protein [Chitiniphilus eburneus]TJZ79186.1 hypothetical protein FAZ21_02560 [Chitiniphilus eburneus]